MDLAVLATVFGLILVAELPDKSALVSLVLGTKYRTGPVLTGVFAAFAVHVVIAIAAGSLLTLLPRDLLDIVVAVLFGTGAVVLLLRKPEPQHRESASGPDTVIGPDGPGNPPGGVPRHGGVATVEAERVRAGRPPAMGLRKATLACFAVVFVAEFGDLTQIMIANLAANYDDPFAVGLGSLLGLWAVGALAVLGGKQLLRWVPLVWVTRVAALAMAAMCALSVLRVATG